MPGKAKGPHILADQENGQQRQHQGEEPAAELTEQPVADQIDRRNRPEAEQGKQDLPLVQTGSISQVGQPAGFCRMANCIDRGDTDDHQRSRTRQQTHPHCHQSSGQDIQHTRAT